MCNEKIHTSHFTPHIPYSTFTMPSFFKWFINAIPRAPKKSGVLMAVYFWWLDYFTPAGRALASLFLLAMFAGLVPGFWAAWIFAGLDFLLFLGLVFSLFVTAKRSKISVESVSVNRVREGETATVSAFVAVRSTIDCVTLGANRLPPSLTGIESDREKIKKGEPPRKMECFVRTTRRGSFMLSKVSANVPEIMGLLRWPYGYNGSVELLVYPRALKVQDFPFLTQGASGMVFAPFLMPSLTRGMNFIGVREYREGDSLRDLHHKAFARYGRPFTKEFEVERGAGVILLLDTATPHFKSRQYLEHAIRIVAAVGEWLLDREILGRFFIDNEEISLNGGNESRKDLLDALARIPSASLAYGKKPASWAPAARPMDPVLRVGLYANEDPFVNKHIVVGLKSTSTQDDLLVITPEECENLESGVVL